MSKHILTILGVLALLGLTLVAVAKLAPAGGAAFERAPATDLTTLLWYVFAALAVTTAALTALHPKIIYAGLSLLGTFGAIAAIFVFLSADFLAVTQVAVYIGGILVLILFAVMLTNRIGTDVVTNPSVKLPVAVGLGVLLLGLLAYGLGQTGWSVAAVGAPTESTASLGHALLTTYLLPFEVASVLLVAVIIGAVIVVRKEVRPDADEAGPRA
ncbi:MAG: NADH-quinone oxidoreductase subunit J [Deltaproteobacteria bacterium]|nr:NADH-quinone oxidoreductase subunit J [Deltaproteobacteria bacterium]